MGHPSKFLIVGAGELESELRSLIDARGVADCVQMLGFRTDVGRLLAASDVFALPSLDEGMPMSLLEAAAAPIPIIATEVGDVARLVVDAVSGLLIPTEQPQALADTIVRLKTDESLRARLAAHAYERLVSQYSNQAMCAHYIDIYSQLLAVPG